MPQSWSWKVCILIAAVAVTLDVLILQSPLVWLVVAGVLAVLAQFRSPISGLAVVVFTCGLLNFLSFEAGALSRLYPGNFALGFFILAWFVCSSSFFFTRFFLFNSLNNPFFV